MASITVTTIIDKPIADVRNAWTQPEHITQWNFASDDWCCPTATNDVTEGGVFVWRMEAKDGSFGFDFTGQYDVVEPMSKLAYTMGEFKDYFVPAGRKAQVLFEKIGDNQTQVTEVFDAEEVHSLEMQQAGRQAILDNFKKHVEGQVISNA
ncbi:MAG: SRPBCC domain-containing protein [Candidatus Absconditabacterales bacterium]